MIEACRLIRPYSPGVNEAKNLDPPISVNINHCTALPHCTTAAPLHGCQLQGAVKRGCMGPDRFGFEPGV